MSKECKSCDLLKQPKKMEELIEGLKENKKIYFRKLDLYHNITATELLEYGKNVIRQEPFINKTIIDSMDGSIESSKIYMDRRQTVDKLWKDTYKVKFKDVPKGLKDERFTPLKI